MVEMAGEERKVGILLIILGFILMVFAVIGFVFHIAITLILGAIGLVIFSAGLYIIAYIFSSWLRTPTYNEQGTIKIKLRLKQKIAAGIIFFFLYIFYLVYTSNWGLSWLAGSQHAFMTWDDIISIVFEIIIFLVFFILFLVLFWALVKKSIEFRRAWATGTLAIVPFFALIFIDVLILYVLSYDLHWGSDVIRPMEAQLLGILGLIFFVITRFILIYTIGIFFGLIYAILYDKLPGKTNIKKAIILGLIFWLIFPIGILSIRLNPEYFSDLTYYLLYPVIVGLLGYLLLAYIQGKIWNWPLLGRHIRSPKRLRCDYCGNKVDLNSSFCSKCGNKLRIRLTFFKYYEK